MHICHTYISYIYIIQIYHKYFSYTIQNIYIYIYIYIDRYIYIYIYQSMIYMYIHFLHPLSHEMLSF